VARLGGFPFELPSGAGEICRVAFVDLVLGFAAYLALSQMFTTRKA
jgi:hypothetical protein